MASIEAIQHTNPWTHAAEMIHAVQAPRIAQGLEAAAQVPGRVISQMTAEQKMRGPAVTVEISATAHVLREITASPLAQLGVASGRTPLGTAEEGFAAISLGAQGANSIYMQISREMLQPNAVNLGATMERVTLNAQLLPASQSVRAMQEALGITGTRG